VFIPSSQTGRQKGREAIRGLCPERTLIKKKIKFFLIYNEIPNGAVAKSFMSKGLLIQYMKKCANIYPYMRTPLVIYDFATAPF
jgi:hypothetical protein